MKEADIDHIFRNYRNIAVVGLSKDESKDSHRVAKYLKGKGFNIIPINPTADEILGEKVYPSLSSLPRELMQSLEIVDIFRPSGAIPPIVDEALEIRKLTGRPFVIWMQLGIRNEEAAEKAEESGMVVIQDMCMMIEGASREDMIRVNLSGQEPESGS